MIYNEGMIDESQAVILCVIYRGCVALTALCYYQSSGWQVSRFFICSRKLKALSKIQNFSKFSPNPPLPHTALNNNRCQVKGTSVDVFLIWPLIGWINNTLVDSCSYDFVRENACRLGIGLTCMPAISSRRWPLSAYCISYFIGSIPGNLSEMWLKNDINLIPIAFSNKTL